MCEYVFKNGKKCRDAPLEGSKYCALHISFEKGERLFGREELKKLKEEAFKKKIEKGWLYFEGVYLYEAKISNAKFKKNIIFNKSKILTLNIEKSEIDGNIICININSERVVIIDTKVKNIVIRNSEIFGLNIVKLSFYENVLLYNNQIRYIMLNDFHFEGRIPKTEERESYSEREYQLGKVEIKNLSNLRRIAVNSKYPYLDTLLQQENIKYSEITRKKSKANLFALSGIKFDESPKLRRQVRVSIRNVSAQLVMEDLSIPGHVYIATSRITRPEFINVKIHNNLIFNRVYFVSDEMWNLTALPNIATEVTINGYMLVEDCRFSNPEIEEAVYKKARKIWEEHGDKEKADEYFYHEMVARRKRKLRRAGQSLRRFLEKIKLGIIGKIFGRILKKLSFLQIPRKLRKLILLLETFAEWLLADLTCKYGTDWKRPIILWVFMVNIVFPILYYSTQSVYGNGVPLTSFLAYEYFSIVTATTLGYGDLHPLGIGRVIASIEAIFGMFMWAVFLTVFARKYMRH
jgi:hypothetical protein